MTTSNKLHLIGIAGTDGSGKDSLGEYLRDKYDWTFLSVTDSLREEASRRDIPLSRFTLREISAEWRRKYGLAVLVDRAIEKHKHSKNSQSAGLIIASLRNPGEVDRVHELGGIVVWVEAAPKVRYERIHTRNRGNEDHVTYEEFCTEEKAQSHRSGDEATLSLVEVKAKADVHIDNSGQDIKTFYQQANRALENYFE